MELGQDKEMNGRTEFYNEVKWVVVLSVTRTLGSHKTFTSYGDVITVPAFGFWSLEDKAVLPGSTLKLYGEKTAKLFLSAEKRIIEEAADCHEANSQDWENDLQAVLTQYNWSWYWILVVHNVLVCLCVTTLCYHMFHLPRSPEFSSLFEKVTGQELEEDNKTQDSVTLPPVSVSLSKEGRVSCVYSNSGMSDALLNHKMDTPTSEKLQGMEEIVEFYSYDWSQSPRPPELSKTRNLVSLLYISALVTGLIEDQGNGALVIIV
ncbi:hypothetical protein Bca52824_002697 [Brassica carinata]|uniref:Uncharacterized protein n=1 Tax=Brassica carinata TaxID=52824 RepID=A0A8X7WLC0_BRACI|nr:hypothetical protein Bca52824_002697 [Brassica carinata]